MTGIAKARASGAAAFRQACGIAVVTASLALSGAHGQSLDEAVVPRIMASNGVVVPMPGIAGLDCGAMVEALRRIDLSNYRGQEPLPPGHRDWPIFDYEDRLARTYYTECMLREHTLGDPGAAFSFGFEMQ